MRIAVVGDVLLDIDIDGAAERLSPDAPVPVIEVERQTRRAGGAGLVATMLHRDGHEVTLVTVLSADARRLDLLGALQGIDVVAGDSGAPTPTKSRLRANGHAIARIDEGCTPPPAPAVTDEMLAALASVDAIVVADYGRGVVADERIRAALADRASSIPLVWDPHPRGAVPIPEATAVTPNLAEATTAADVHGSSPADAVTAASRLRSRWGCETVVVTLGARGALVDTGDGDATVVPAPAVSTTDPCGAGDRFAGTLAVALASTSSVPDAVRIAATDAAAFLNAGGVSALTSPPLPPAIHGAAGAALAVAASVRESGGTVVATGGCFDLMHAGHVRTLSAARALGDCLIVCLNSDASVRRLKGEERPIVAEQDRVDMLLALECVDAVLVFDDDTPESAIRRLIPAVWVKGGDYSADALPETAVLAEWGGRTVTVPFHLGHSTSRLAGALSRVG